MYRLRERSSEAFDELIRVYGPGLMATTRRMLREADQADDALQEVLVSAFQSIDRFEGRCPLGAWLNRIAVNACLMRLRTRRARPEVEIDELLPVFNETGQFAETQYPWVESADAELLRGERVAQVQAAIAQLPEKYRVVVVLRDIEGLEYKAIADQMGLTENAVKIRVHRGRQALRSLLNEVLESR